MRYRRPRRTRQVERSFLRLAALGRATYLEFPGIGHDAWDTSACSLAITLAFLADPDAPLDTSCGDAITGPRFPG